jgi:hypothetical protein
MCRNHSFQFFPQFPNTLSPLVVFQDIGLVHVAQLARLPNIQLRLVELDEFRANLLDAIHIGTFCDRTGMVKKGKGLSPEKKKSVIVSDSFLDV